MPEPIVKQQTYVDEAVDDLYSLRGQIGAVIYLMSGKDIGTDSVREDVRAYLENIQEQIIKTLAFLADGRMVIRP